MFARSKDLIHCYRDGEWALVSIGVYIRKFQPLGWLVTTRKMIEEGQLPEASVPDFIVDDGTESSVEEPGAEKRNVTGSVVASDMRPVGAEFNAGFVSIVNVGDKTTWFLRGAEGRMKTLRFTYSTSGTGDREAELSVVGGDFTETVSFPEHKTDPPTTVDVPDVPLDELATKLRLMRPSGMNGRVNLYKVEIV